MAKKKTSRKRGFSFDAMPSRRLKRGAPVTDHDPKASLADRKFIIEALTEALMNGDAQAFKEILAAHLEVVRKESFYERAGLSRRTPEGLPLLQESARRRAEALSYGWAQALAKTASSTHPVPRDEALHGELADDGRSKSGGGAAHHAPQRSEADHRGLRPPRP